MSTIKLIKGSCVDQNVDAIVNAANRNLLSGGGICGAIFKKAGYKELSEACFKCNPPINDGEAVITPAFNINNTKYIIHAVGPNFSITPNAFKELYNAYYNSLILLKNNNLHSISFPLISAGIFGGNLDNPVKESTKQCLRAYNSFIEIYKDYDLDVMLCAYMDREYMDALEEFNIKDR